MPRPSFDRSVESLSFFLDLAARNVLVGESNTVKIADFGLARIIKVCSLAKRCRRCSLTRLGIRGWHVRSEGRNEVSHQVDGTGSGTLQSIHCEKRCNDPPVALFFSLLTVFCLQVWSYGVLLTELVTFGRTPYPGMTNAEVLRQVDQGYRLPQPTNCPVSLYTIMRDCWHAQPETRPSFTTLQFRLENEYNGENPEFSN